MTQKQRIAPFPAVMTEAVANVLAQTDPPGLTGRELERLLPAARLSGWEGGSSKRDRLFVTLNNAQVRQVAGNVLVAFVNAAMQPSRYTGEPERWEQLRDELNVPLSLHGYRIDESGRFARARKAETLDEAAEVAGSLQVQLRRRGCHPVVLAYCQEELLRHSLFHAISEAAKSIPARLRHHLGSGLDGADLYAEAFGAKQNPPSLRINNFATESERSEHRGFVDLLKGVHGHYRNPRAHDTRLGSSEDQQDLLDAFALFSYVHRRLDAAQVR